MNKYSRKKRGKGVTNRFRDRDIMFYRYYFITENATLYFKNMLFIDPLAF